MRSQRAERRHRSHRINDLGSSPQRPPSRVDKNPRTNQLKQVMRNPRATHHCMDVQWPSSRRSCQSARSLLQVSARDLVQACDASIGQILRTGSPVHITPTHRLALG